MEKRGFTFRNGFLYCEDVRVKDIQTDLSTNGIVPSSPCFVYSKEKIVSNISAYQTALKMLNISTLLNFSMKANHTPAILQIVRSMGCSVTLVSGMELKMALKLGFDPRLTVFNGNGKQDWERLLAIEEGCLINVDSSFDLMQTMRMCQKLRKTSNVLLRINPDIDPQVHPFISTGLANSKFGINTEDLEECVTLLKKCSQITLVGLHCHLGSTIHNVTVFRLCTMKLLSLKSELKTRGFNNIKYINIGGGLGINYKQLAGRTSPARSSCTMSLEDGYTQTAVQGNNARQLNVTERVSQNDLDYNSGCSELMHDDLKVPTPGGLVECIQSALVDSEVTLILEPGRSLVGNTAILATTVLGTKGNQTKRFIVIDGAMTEVPRPSLYGAYHHIELSEPTDIVQVEKTTNRSSLNDPHRKVYDVVGPVCESTDFLGKERLLPEPHEGCGLAIFDVGAYCSSMSSNYNLRLRPCEVMVDGSTWHIIRRPDTFADLFEPYEGHWQ
ncbi:uncharacterized protein [Haliotis cracherodii]|uniref:uncharacterized protein n=1 Tax=Haliotis cracherodii TaxID=6455 RepID=UPI0039E8DD64